MSSEAELESLVIRIKADAEGYKRDIESAAGETKRAADEVKESAARIEGFTDSIKGFAQGAMSTLASVGASGFLKDVFDSFSEAERVGISLSATLKAQGRDVDATMKDYGAFAEEMQNLTSLSDELFQGMLETAEGFDLTGDAAKRAVKDAVGLAKGNAQSASSMIRLTAAMEQGDTRRAMMFARMIPQLRGVRNESEFVARYQKLVAAGIDAASEASQTASGRLQLLDETWGNFKEQLGETVAEGLKPVVDIAIEAVRWFQALSPEVKKAIVAIFAVTAAVTGLTAVVTLLGIVWNLMTGGVFLVIGAIVTAGAGLAVWVGTLGGIKAAWEKLKPVIEFVKTAILVAFISGEFAMQNWKRLAVLAWMVVKLEAISAFNTISFFFTTRLPEYFNWFKENVVAIASWWKENWIEVVKLIWTYIWDNAKLLGSNLMRTFENINWAGMWIGFTTAAKTAANAVINNLKSVFSNLKGILKGSVNFADSWKDEAVTATNSVAVELQTLPDDVKGIVSKIKPLVLPSLQLKEHKIPEAEEKLRKEVEVMANEIGGEFGQFLVKRMTEFRAAGAAAQKDAGKGGKKNGDAMSKGMKGESGQFQHAAFRSLEALSRISASAERNSPVAANAPPPNANDLKQTNIMHEQTGLLRQIADKPGIEDLEVID